MIPADGVEHSISLSGISWSEDDKEPGQIQFYFAVPEQTAVVSVKLYVGEEWRYQIREKRKQWILLEKRRKL